MPTFTWRAQYGAEVSKEPKVLMANFGDGYQQRAADGINTGPQTWNLQFKYDNTTADAIESFLATQAGWQSFDWTPPGRAAIKAICPTWRLQRTTLGVSTIQATFMQVFEP